MNYSYGTRAYGGSAIVTLSSDLGEINISAGGETIVYIPQDPSITGGVIVAAPTVVEIEYLPQNPTITLGTVHDATPVIEHDYGMTISPEFDRAIYMFMDGEHEINTITSGDNAVYVETGYRWWNHNWPYRRYLEITPPLTGLERGHPITAYVPRDITRQGKTRDDLEDIQVSYLVSLTPEVWKVLPSSVDTLSTHYRVRFNLPEAIYHNATPSESSTVGGIHFIYYGNKSLREDPLVPTYSFNEYPLEVTWDGGEVTYTNPGKDWSDNESLVRGAKANFTFYGEQLRLYATTGRAWGEMLVTVTNTSADETVAPGTTQVLDATPTDDFSVIVDLYNDDEDEENLVFTVTGLPDKLHHLRIEDIGTSNPLSTDVKINLTKVRYKKHAIAVDIREEADNNMKWSVGTGGGANS